jgi:single-strand DNA-binding protein
MARKKSTASAPTPKSNAPAPAAGSEAPAESPTVLRGRLCADPELRHTASSGKPVTSIRVAVNDGPEPTFHSVVVWGRQAEVVCEYLRKGRLIEVTGRSQERSWRAQDGSERRVAEVVAYRVQFLSAKSSAPVAAEEQS